MSFRAESSQSATGQESQVGGREGGGGPCEGLGIAKCVSVLGQSQFHKHLALRNPSPAQRGL